MTPRLWRLTPDRAAEWREIRLAALALDPDAFGTRLAEWQDRPLAAFAARLAATEVWAAGDTPGQPRAVAAWQPGWTPGTEDMGWITAVFTRPEARGRGLMAAILARIAERASAAGFARLGLHVGCHNLTAQRVYRRAGFAPEGAPFRNERGIPEIEMHRPLHGDA